MMTSLMLYQNCSVSFYYVYEIKKQICMKGDSFIVEKVFL